MNTAAQKPRYSALTSLLLTTYSAIKRSGILERPFFQRLFQDAYFLYKRFLEDPFHGFCGRYPAIFQGGLVLDIGANCGYTALVFSRAVGRGGRVFAFEPDPTNVSMMRELTAREHLEDRLTIVPAAVGASEGTLQLWRNLSHHADHRIITDSFRQTTSDQLHTAITVPVHAVDDFLPTHANGSMVSFIKIDVQGFEPPVCAGLVKTLQESPNVVVALEYCPAQIKELGFSDTELLSFFETRGFSWSILERNGRTSPFSPEALETIIQARGYADLIASRRPLSEYR